MAVAKKSEKLASQFRKAASTNNNRVHVISGSDGWSVKREGSTRAIVVKDSKESALLAAHQLKKTSRIVIHEKDGTIQIKTIKKEE